MKSFKTIVGICVGVGVVIPVLLAVAVTVFTVSMRVCIELSGAFGF